MLMAGTLRAEATLGLANFVFLLLLAGGGVIIPLSKFPSGVRHVLDALPISALTNGLRDVLQHGATPALGQRRYPRRLGGGRDRGGRPDLQVGVAGP